MIITQINKEKARFKPASAVDCNPSLGVQAFKNTQFGTVYCDVAASDPGQLRTLRTILAALSFYASARRCPVCSVLLDDCFGHWSDVCAMSGLPLGVFYAATLDGKPYRAIDHLYRRRHGWSKKLLPRLLAFWPQEVYFEGVRLRHTGEVTAHVGRCFCISYEVQGALDE